MACGGGAACCAPAQPEDPYKDHGMLPDERRKCRDVFCCLLFVLFCVGMLILGAIGIRYGKPQRLVYGTDYLGRTCGVDAGVASLKYTTYPRVTEDFIVNVGKTNPLDYKFYGICVRSCPGLLEVVCNSEYPALTAGAPYTQAVLLDCLTTPGYAPPPGVDCSQVASSCWVTPQATSSTFFRCVPDYNISTASDTACIFPANVTDASDPRCVLAQTDTGTTIQRPAKPNFLFDQMNTARQLWGRWFGDLQRAWWVVLVCGVGLAVVLGFGFTLLMKTCTGCMVWTTVVLVVLAFAALDIFFYYKGGLISWDLVPDDVEARLRSIIPRVTLPNIGINTNDLSRAASALVPDGFISSQIDRQQAYRILAYIFSAIVIIVFAIVVALRRSISTAVSVIKLGADALRHMPLLILFPPLGAIGFAAFLLWWVFVAASLATAGTITVGSLEADAVAGASYLATLYPNGTLPGPIASAVDAAVASANATNLASFNDFPVLNYLLIYHFFGLLWVTQFTNGIVAMTIAGAVCGWYFSLNEAGNPDVEARRYKRGRWPICGALGRTLRYYLGSVAFGSLLIALMQFVRAVFAYVQRRLQKGAGPGGPGGATRFALCCLQCCLKCLQVVLEMVTRNAYVWIALKGTGFCAAGKAVFGLLLANAGSLLFVNVLSEVIMFVGKVGIAAAAGWGCYVLLDTVPAFGPGGSDAISSSWLIVLVTMFFAYAVAAAFMGIFDLAVDSILVCYVTDMDEAAQRGQGRVAVHVKADKLGATFTKKGRAAAKRAKDDPETVAGVNPMGPPPGAVAVAPARNSAPRF